jgi:hypothetical protein
MKKIIIKCNSKTVGAIDSANFTETRPADFFGPATINGSVGQIKFDSINLSNTFIRDIANHNAPLQLEFEYNNAIHQVKNAWVSSYTVNEEPNGIMVVENLRFDCESMFVMNKEQDVSMSRKNVVQDIKTVADKELEMINKFSAAVSNHYKESK